MCLAARKELACDSICDDIQIANIKLGALCDADKLPVVIVGELESVVCFVIGICDLIGSRGAGAVVVALNHQLELRLVNAWPKEPFKKVCH